jgi:hypothetical protein
VVELFGRFLDLELHHASTDPLSKALWQLQKEKKKKEGKENPCCLKGVEA